MTRTRPAAPDLTTTGADPRDLRALTHACAAVDSGLIVVTSADVGMAAAAAAAVARADRPDTAREPADTDLDVHLAFPSGAAWTVADVEDAILRPARLRPLRRAHIVVTDADRIAATAADRLLKVVEEPRNDILFWFCVSGALPATLLSRAARVLPVRAAGNDELIAALRSTGAADGAAEEIARLCGTNSRLALAAARGGHLDALRTFTDAPGEMLAGPLATPTCFAHRWACAVYQLAAALRSPTGKGATGGDPKQMWDKLDTTARVEARRLVRDSLASVTAAAQERVARTGGLVELRDLGAVSAVCAQAAEELDMNGTPLVVLAALSARWTEAAAPR